MKRKNTVVLFKVESSYGVDPTMIGDNALQVVSNLQTSPLKTEVVERDLIQGFYGQNERVTAHKESKISFEVELAGHAGMVLGVMPKIDPLIRACGFVGSQSTRAIASITRVGAVATVTTTGSHGLATNDKVYISGAAETEYNSISATVTVTGATTFTYAVTGTPATPATGTIVMRSGYVYTPISASIPSVAFATYVDGVCHKMLGCRGNMSIDLSVKTIPKLKFEFTGIYVAPTDSANPTPVVSEFTVPLASNTTNTTGFALLGYSGYLESLSLNLNNVVNFKNLIGSEMVELNDRKISGSISLEATTIAQKDFWSAVLAQTTGALVLTHGTQCGNKVAINCPRVMLDSPEYKELNMSMMLTANISVLPNTGNDEMTLTFQ